METPELDPGRPAGRDESAPAVSVVIPTYNAADFLGAAIESALGQSFGDFELLVLDNASTDATPDVVRQLAEPRLCYHRNPENLGFLGNANLGARLARAPLLAYLGADDLWEREFLARTVAVLAEDPGLAFVHTGALYIDPAGRTFARSRWRWPPVAPGERAFRDCFREGFCFSALVMRTPIVRGLGEFDPVWKEFADQWLFLRLCLAGRVGYLDEPLVRYRVHDQSISAGMVREGRYFRDHIRLVRQAFNWSDARAQSLDRELGEGMRHVVREWLKAVHLVRGEGSRRAYLRTFAEVAGAAPEVMAWPGAWARLAFGLLPRPMIRGLQEWRRARATRRFRGGG